MGIKSFEEYFKEYKCYDDGGKLDKGIIADAKKVFEKLKTPEAILEFQEADPQEQEKMVKGLDDGHSGFSFACVCQNAYKYALYAKENGANVEAEENVENVNPKRTAAIAEMKGKYPHMVQILTETKNSNGNPLFSSKEVEDFLFNGQELMRDYPDRIMAVLSNPEEIDMISSWANKGAGLWRAVQDPLDSTVKKNPKAFGVEPEVLSPNVAALKRHGGRG